MAAADGTYGRRSLPSRALARLGGVGCLHTTRSPPTSPSTRDDDLTDKVERNAKASVPVYLLLDLQEDSATVFWSPTAKGYASHLTVPFGEKIRVPVPFDCTLDTTGFQAPAEDGENTPN